MKLTYAPLVSDVRGRFEGSVFSSWKGISLLRRFQAPSNPNSTSQQQHRNVFANLTRLYSMMSTYWKAAWDNWATGKPMIGRNKLIGDNVGVLAGDANWADSVLAPADASTIPLVSATFTGGVGQITFAGVEPTLPTGWTIERFVGVAIIDSAPDTVLTFAALTPHEVNDATSPYSVVMSSLAVGTYRCGAFLRWTPPDATIRSSATIQGTATVT